MSNESHEMQPVSLASYIKTSEIVRDIENKLADETHLKIVFSDSFITTYALRLNHLGIGLVENIDSLLREKATLITRFLTSWFLGPAQNKPTLIPQGIAVSFLCWSLILEKGGLNSLEEFTSKFAWNTNRDTKALATSLDQAYHEALSSN